MINEVSNENSIKQQDCACNENETLVDCSPISATDKTDITYSKNGNSKSTKPLFTDVKYKAPFSSKILQVVAYLLLIFSHLHLMSIFVQSVHYEDTPSWFSSMIEFSDIMKSASLPLLLLAVFNRIMNKSRDIRLFVIQYVACSLIFFVIYLLVFYRYLVGSFSFLFDLSREETAAAIFDFLIMSVPKFMNYNIFVDLANCSLFFFFIYYTPKIKSKKFLIFFRSLCVIPVLIVVGCCIFNYTIEFHEVVYPPAIMFILPCRSPSMHLIFFILALFIKYRYVIVTKLRGEEYCSLYKNSNKDNLMFSLFCAVIIILVSILDFLCSFSPIMLAMGFGDSYTVAIVAPITLLFGYNKPIKSSSLDILIPLISFGVIAFIYVEGVYLLFSTIMSL
jgi:hypothetical protein